MIFNNKIVLIIATILVIILLVSNYEISEKFDESDRGVTLCDGYYGKFRKCKILGDGDKINIDTYFGLITIPDKYIVRLEGIESNRYINKSVDKKLIGPYHGHCGSLKYSFTGTLSVKKIS